MSGIFEMKREQLILSWLNKNIRPNLCQGYVYAHMARVFPYCHILSQYLEERSEQNPLEEKSSKVFIFDDIYIVKHSFIEKVILFLDDTWRSEKEEDKNKIKFSNLENKFSEESTDEKLIIREKLIKTIRYLGLANVKFTQDYYDGFYEKIWEYVPAPSYYEDPRSPLTEGEVLSSLYETHH